MKEVNQYLTGKALTGKKLKSVKAVVIHWFNDPMAKATNVIKFWQRQANGISAHDVICLDGTVFHAVPYDAMAYQVGCARGYTKEALSRLSGYPNDCVVGIECAHLDNKGTMTPETYASLVQLSAKLLKKYGLNINDLWLHSEIVGKDYKDCHRWFTTTKPEDWPKFKSDVNAILKPAPVHKPVAKKPAVKVAESKANLGIKAVGKIKIVEVKHAAYIVDRPSVTGYNLTTIDRGAEIDISGSIPGWWEVIYHGKRAYVNAKFGEKI